MALERSKTAETGMFTREELQEIIAGNRTVTTAMRHCIMMYLFSVYSRHLALTNTLWLFQRHTSACQVSSSARGSRNASHLTCAATARTTVEMERTRQTAVRPSFHLYFNTFILLWSSWVVLKAAFVLACFCEKGLEIESEAEYGQVFCAMM